MLHDFKLHVDSNLKFLNNSKFLIAVSGGIDSIVLTHLCKQANYNFAIAHCNFNLRGEESDADELFINELGDSWSNGIRSIIFRYKNKDGEYKEIKSKKSFELKCLEQKRFLNQPYKQNNNRGNKWITDTAGNKIKDQDADKVEDNVIYTANLCENGNYDQNFYLTNDDDSKFVDSYLYDNIDSDHIHFHRHSYDLLHEGLEDINDI